MSDDSGPGESTTAAGTTGVPWNSRTVQVVLASTALAPLGVPLISPTLPAIRDALVLSDAEASLLVSTYFLTGIVLSPVIGLVVDRLGRRRVLVPSLFVFGLLGGTIALAPPYEVVLATRFVQGTAAAGIFITTATLVGDAFEGVQRNAVFGVNAAVLSAGAAAYPLLGGYLVGFGWQVPFVAYIAAVPIAVVAWVLLPEPVRTGSRPRPSLGRLRAAFTRREATALYGTTLLVELLLFGTVLTAIPFLLADSYGLAALSIGLVLTAGEVAAMVAAALNGRLAERFGDYEIVRIGFFSVALGLAVAWFASSPVVVGLGTVATGAGWGFVLPSVDDAVAGTVAAEVRASALSFRNSTTFLGRASGPILFTGFAAATGYRPLLLAAGVVAAVAGVAVVALVPSERPEPQAVSRTPDR